MANERRKPQQPLELGYGVRASKGHQRLVNPDGSFNVRKRGERAFTISDAYHILISLEWWKFFGILISAFVVINFLFAAIYYLIGPQYLTGMIADTDTDKFWESFFFSSQTLTTLGYGRVSPVGFWSSAVAAFESALGLLGFALSTSLLWGRFSRPTSKILFSGNALIAPYHGGRGLMLRLINAGRSRLIETSAEVTMARTETVDGKKQRRFYILRLELTRVSVLPTSWTLVHPMDEESPLAGRSEKDLDDEDTEVLVVIKAFDETYAQTIYSRTSYKFHEIIRGAKFLQMVEDDPDGVLVLDMDKLNAYETADLPSETTTSSQ
jgi:inward rectifier potassium channel